MNKKLIPTYTTSSIFNINFLDLKHKGYESIFIDLDNTLESPYVYTPSDKVINLINTLKSLNFNVFIISNNKEERVKKYALNLNIKYFYEVKKPSTKRIKKFILDNNIDLSCCISIGDQVMTDVLLANKLKIDVILVNPLTINDEPITFIPRLLDKHYRKIIFKKKLSKEI